MINWEEVVKEARFDSEREMWKYYFRTCDLGVTSISKLIGVSPPMISKRLKKMGYKIRGPGGNNWPRVERLKQEKKNMEIKKCAKLEN